MIRETLRLALTNVCGHLLHLGLLLLPSLILRSSGQWDLALILFSIAVLVAGIVESFIVSRVRVVNVRNNDVPGRNRDALAMTMAQAVGVLMLTTFWFAQIEAALFEINSMVLMPIGLAMVAIGILLRASAIFSLGSNFVSDIRCDTAIVKTGVYRILRHPSEHGLLLVSVGAPLLLGATLAAVFATMTLVPISVWRMLRENSFLASLNVRQTTTLSSTDDRELTIMKLATSPSVKIHE